MILEHMAQAVVDCDGRHWNELMRLVRRFALTDAAGLTAWHVYEKEQAQALGRFLASEMGEGAFTIRQRRADPRMYDILWEDDARCAELASRIRGELAAGSLGLWMRPGEQCGPRTVAAPAAPAEGGTHAPDLLACTEALAKRFLDTVSVENLESRLDGLPAGSLARVRDCAVRYQERPSESGRDRRPYVPDLADIETMVRMCDRSVDPGSFWAFGGANSGVRLLPRTYVRPVKRGECVLANTARRLVPVDFNATGDSKVSPLRGYLVGSPDDTPRDEVAGALGAASCATLYGAEVLCEGDDDDRISPLTFAADPKRLADYVHQLVSRYLELGGAANCAVKVCECLLLTNRKENMSVMVDGASCMAVAKLLCRDDAAFVSFMVAVAQDARLGEGQGTIPLYLSGIRPAVVFGETAEVRDVDPAAGTTKGELAHEWFDQMHVADRLTIDDNRRFQSAEDRRAALEACRRVWRGGWTRDMAKLVNVDSSGMCEPKWSTARYNTGWKHTAASRYLTKVAETLLNLPGAVASAGRAGGSPWRGREKLVSAVYTGIVTPGDAREQVPRGGRAVTAWLDSLYRDQLKEPVTGPGPYSRMLVVETNIKVHELTDLTRASVENALRIIARRQLAFGFGCDTGDNRAWDAWRCFSSTAFDVDPRAAVAAMVPDRNRMVTAGGDSTCGGDIRAEVAFDDKGRLVAAVYLSGQVCRLSEMSLRISAKLPPLDAETRALFTVDRSMVGPLRIPTGCMGSRDLAAEYTARLVKLRNVACAPGVSGVGPWFTSPEDYMPAPRSEYRVMSDITTVFVPA